MYQKSKLERAKQRVADITAFYFHAAIYVTVVGLMFAINLTASPEWWVHWPMLGWGLGLIAHEWAVFGRLPRRVARWQVRKIKQLVERIE